MDLYRTVFYLFSLWVASMAALASPVAVDLGQQGHQLTDFPVEYFIDDSQSLDYEAVRKQAFQETTSTTTLGTRATVTWYRVALHNPGAESRSLFLHLPKAYHVRSIDVFEERSEDLVDQASVDLNDASDHPLMYRGTVVYPFTVPPGKPRLCMSAAMCTRINGFR